MRVLTGLSCSHMGSMGVGAASRACALALLEGDALRSLGFDLAVLPDGGLDLGLASGVGASNNGPSRALARTVLTAGVGGSMRLLLGVLTGTTF